MTFLTFPSASAAEARELDRPALVVAKLETGSRLAFLDDDEMLTAHHIVAFAVIVVCGAGAATALVVYRRGSGAGRVVAHVLALAQTLLVAQVGLGLLLLSDHRRAADRLHYLYGALALFAVVSPWLYAPADPRRRLAWFGGATLVAAALGVRAYMTAT